ncbi:serine/threonine-protein kinase TIO-like [Durio zibethinus]|uniref:non-specific serine/threonine protein kinase n=1 Tax=Durio zibethinus TaxID=66656 RepID=A0A6P5Z5K6_DURZI|nr:serine/threonine-protein kinase TIO-like [Durio zibethinus]
MAHKLLVRILKHWHLFCCQSKDGQKDHKMVAVIAKSLTTKLKDFKTKKQDWEAGIIIHVHHGAVRAMVCFMMVQFYRGHVLHSSQSLRILSNLVAAGALHSGGIIDEIMCELLNFTVILVGLKSSGVNELVAKSFSVIKMLLAENNGSGVANSYFKHWFVLVEIFPQVVGHIEDASGTVFSESCACITTILAGVAQGLRAYTLNQILDHTVTSCLVDHLCLCLATSGSNLSSGSTYMLHAVCEACRAIWSLMDALEILFVKENPNLDHARCLLAGESAKVLDAVTMAFVRSKAVQFALVHCLHERVEPALSAAILVFLHVSENSSMLRNLSRCCLHNGIIPTVLCGLPNSLHVTTVVSGGADGTIVSEIFSILSLCSSLIKDAQPETSNLKCKKSNPPVLPHSASAMLALASILSLEGGLSVESSISEISMPLIPQTSTLCDHLKISSDSEIEVGPKNPKVVLSYWHGLRDECVGFNHSSASSQGVGGPNSGVGLSPIGVVWAVSSVCQCLSGVVLTFRQTLLCSEHVKLIYTLISAVHLKLVRSWFGPGGGKDGVRDVINAVIDFLAFPLVAVQNATGLPLATTL